MCEHFVFILGACHFTDIEPISRLLGESGKLFQNSPLKHETSDGNLMPERLNPTLSSMTNITAGQLSASYGHLH